MKTIAVQSRALRRGEETRLTRFAAPRLGFFFVVDSFQLSLDVSVATYLGEVDSLRVTLTRRSARDSRRDLPGRQYPRRTCSSPPDPPYASRPRSASARRPASPEEPRRPRYAAEVSRPSRAPPLATLARVRRYPRPSAHRVSDPSSRRAAAGCAARRRMATSKASATRRTSVSLQSPRLTRTPTRTTSPRRCPTRSRTNRATPPTKRTRTTASSCRAPKSTKMPSNPPKARIGLTRLFFPCSAFRRRLSVTAFLALHVAHITAWCNNQTSYVDLYQFSCPCGNSET